MSRFLLLFLFLPALLVGQKHDYNWVFGYSILDNPQDSIWGTTIMDFNYNPPLIYYDGYKKMDYDRNTSCISSEAGKFLFSSDGYWLENFQNLPIENDDFYTGEFNNVSGPQASLIIPLEKDSNKFAHFHSVWDWITTVTGRELYYSEIDFNINNGLGKVSLLNEQILSDTLETSKLTGTKHGNGKDWWILTRDFGSNNYKKILFDGDSFKVYEQQVGIDTHHGFGQACFSPDGSKYANASSISIRDGRYFDLYDFDRCSGELSNHFQAHDPRDGISGGIAFSPNSRFLYVSGFDKIFQYDTWADSLLASEVLVAEYDGFLDSIPQDSGFVFLATTHFLMMQLGPDGKIYINTPSSTRYLHVIDSPDEKGLACNVRQHGIRLITLNTSIPSFPNYRLGALEGSLCDTLSIESEDEGFKALKVFPNPANHQLHIDFGDDFPKKAIFHLFDSRGIQVKTLELTTSFQTIDLDGLASGFYFYQIRENGRVLKKDKLVVMR